MPIYYATGSPDKGFLWAFLSGLSEPIGGIQNGVSVGDSNVDAAEAFAAPVGVFDEPQGGIVELHRWIAISIGREVDLGDLGPPLCQAIGFWAL